MTNEELYNLASESIQKLFEDLNVPIEQCIENLLSLKEEIDTLIDSLENY